MTFVFALGNLCVTGEDSLIYNKGVGKLVFIATAVIFIYILEFSYYIIYAGVLPRGPINVE